MNPEIIKTNSALEHIDTMIANIKSLIDNKQDFIGFVIIAIGIEFLGSFYDGFDFNDFGQSEARFKNALSNLFKDQRYRNKKDWLFKQLRGPLIHQYRPGDEILLTSKCKNDAPLELHWKPSDLKTVFVLEKLFDDFKSAVQKLNNEIEKASNPLNKEKISGEYMAIKEINILPEDNIFGNTPFIPSSGTTISHITVSNYKQKKSKKKPK